MTSLHEIAEATSVEENPRYDFRTVRGKVVNVRKEVAEGGVESTIATITMPYKVSPDFGKWDCLKPDGMQMEVILPGDKSLEIDSAVVIKAKRSPKEGEMVRVERDRTIVPYHRWLAEIRRKAS